MKTVLVILLSVCSLLFFNAAYADDNPAQLHMKISGPVNNNTYFLCLPDMGCVSIYAGNHGKAFPMDSGKVRDIFLANVTNFRRYMQPLPSSCQVSVADNQTLTVSGQLVVKDSSASIENLHCSVA